MVVGSMASLNVAEIIVFTAAEGAAFAGMVETTVGAGAVVKVQTKLAARPTPALSFAAVVIVAVNKVLLARTLVGVNVAVEPAKVTVPTTGVASGPVKVNAAFVKVSPFIGSENVALTRVLTATAVAPFVGIVEITVGNPVVKLHTKLAANGFPPGSLAPAVIVAV
jgi:hypothetical protein